MEHFRRKLSEIYPLPPEDLDLFLSAWKRLTLPKSHVILPEGAVCKYIHYISTGGVRCFRMKNGKEIIEWMTMDDSFFYPPISLFRQQPSRLCIQTVEPTTLYVIELQEFEQLARTSHSIERFFRYLLMDGILAGERRIESLMTGTAKQRYKHLISSFPDIANRVPLSHIASFIGVTQETLSRIRGMK